MGPFEIAAGFGMAIMQHHENTDLAINYLVHLYIENEDVFDQKVFNKVMAQYGLLNDGFCSEEEYIKREVKRRLHIV
jgi:hypothetical protein